MEAESAAAAAQALPLSLARSPLPWLPLASRATSQSAKALPRTPRGVLPLTPAAAAGADCDASRALAGGVGADPTPRPWRDGVPGDLAARGVAEGDRSSRWTRAGKAGSLAPAASASAERCADASGGTEAPSPPPASDGDRIERGDASGAASTWRPAARDGCPGSSGLQWDLCGAWNGARSCDEGRLACCEHDADDWDEGRADWDWDGREERGFRLVAWVRASIKACGASTQAVSLLLPVSVP